VRASWILVVAVSLALVIAGSSIASADSECPLCDDSEQTEDTDITGITITSNYTSSPPTIDGIINADEWITMIPITLNGFENTTNTLEGELSVIHDTNNIYIAVEIPDADFDWEDYILIAFDQGNDNVATDGGEDAFTIYFSSLPPGMYIDLHWNASEGGWIMDDETHGAVEYSYDEEVGKFEYEFAKPLKSNDSQDIAVNLGDTLGFRMVVWDETTHDYYRYPLDTVDVDTTRWDEWADLIIALP
jgi:hypothetical protein